MNALPVRRPLGCLKTVMRQARVHRQLRAYATETTPPAAEPPSAHQPAPFRLCTSLAPPTRPILPILPVLPAILYPELS